MAISMDSRVIVIDKDEELYEAEGVVIDSGEESGSFYVYFEEQDTTESFVAAQLGDLGESSTSEFSQGYNKALSDVRELLFLSKEELIAKVLDGYTAS